MIVTILDEAERVHYINYTMGHRTQPEGIHETQTDLIECYTAFLTRR